MPELPEVEVVRQGITPHILHEKIIDVAVRHKQLRLPIPVGLKGLLVGQTILEVQRRGKYLLLIMPAGTLLLHLGMSGSIRVQIDEKPPQKHDHIDILFSNRKYLRFNDPRRFGLVTWTTEDPLKHRLLAPLGPEPLSETFTGKYLWQQARKRKIAVKAFIMDSKVVVGVGNIYATEALFAARIHPLTPANKVSLEQFSALCRIVKTILRKAIKQGGTTLKDFVKSDGKPGYFKVHLQAYGRAGQPCLRCGTLLKQIRIAQRGTVYCEQCQTAATAKGSQVLLSAN